MARVLALLVAGLATSLLPLALAAPVDQTQVPGIYDNGDLDELVLAVLDGDGAVASPDGGFVSQQNVAAVETPDSRSRDAAPLSRLGRGPPTS